MSSAIVRFLERPAVARRPVLSASPFLAEIAGKDRHVCAWSGPNAKAASERLPLLTTGDRRQFAPRRAEPPAPNVGMHGGSDAR